MKLKPFSVFAVSENVEKNKDGKGESEGDYIEETIGAVGSWQVIVSFTAAIIRFVAMGNMTSIVFFTPKTDFVCSEFSDNITVEAENNTCYSNCKRYLYHSDVMETSLISDFDLICDYKWLGSFTQTLLMLGVVFGVIFFGWISDRYGRRITLISSSLLNVVAMISTSFAPYFWVFYILRFMTGFATGGSLIISLPIVMEIIGKRHRETAAALCFLPDNIAEISLAIFAYFLPKWTLYNLGFSIASTIILIMGCFVPESPRWLITNGKVDEAVDLLTGAAKFNKRNTSHIREKVLASVEAMKIKKNNTASYADFFRTKTLVIITLTNLLLWAVVSTTFFGIYQYMTLLEMDALTTVAVMGLIQIPLCPTEIVINKVFNRKTCVIGTFLITGISMLILIFSHQSFWMTAVFGLIGFVASSGCYMILYLYVAELFPTSLRSMAYGLSSAAAKGGSMVAPFIANVTPVWVPSVIFAAMALVAAACSWILPETKGTNLKDIVD